MSDFDGAEELSFNKLTLPNWVGLADEFELKMDKLAQNNSRCSSTGLSDEMALNEAV